MTDLKAEARRLAEEACSITSGRGHQDFAFEVTIIEDFLLAFGRLVREEDAKEVRYLLLHIKEVLETSGGPEFLGIDTWLKHDRAKALE